MSVIEEFAAVLNHAKQKVQARPEWLRNSSTQTQSEGRKRTPKRTSTRHPQHKKKS
jgi:hypothetical protein